MRYTLPGCRISTSNLKRKKVKFSSEAKGVSKASLMRKHTKRLKMDKIDLSGNVSQSNIKVCGYGKAFSSSETLSSISCECHQSLDRVRCTASPQLQQQEGKENVRITYGGDLIEKRDMNELIDHGSAGDGIFPDSDGIFPDSDGIFPDSDSIFPDDDSNQILPVEQFFGNMDTVQECPQRSEAMSLWGHRVHKRRHYYAREDSDEDEPGNTACSS